jgi:hypothetical protein
MSDIVNITVQQDNDIVNIVSSQINEVIDVNVYETVEEVTLNITQDVVQVNINKITGEGQTVPDATSTVKGIIKLTNDLGGTADLPTVPALANKVDKVTGKGLSANDFTDTLKTKLDGIAPGAEVNVNADWNATSGDAQILNKPTIPTQTSQLTNNGADGVNPFITALDIPTTGQASTLVREVKNMTGATLTKGTVVYISGANGNKALVSKALATTDELSSRTFGLLQSNILNNGLGYCVIIGDLSGLDTSSFAEGAQLYLSGVTAGTYTATKNLAPTHLVYVGKVTRSHPTQGQIEVGIQNGYELAEIHDVALSSEANNQALVYESSTDLWKNKTIDKSFVGLGNVDNTSDANKPVSTAQTTAINAKVEDSITDGVTTIAPSQNAVFDALALKQAALSYTPYRNVQTSQTPVTGTVAETILFTVTIPANTFNAIDIIHFFYNVYKTTTLGSYVMRLKINTSNTLSGAVTVGTYNGSATAQIALMNRNLHLNGGNLYGYPSVSLTLISDIVGTSGSLASTALNPANQFFIFGTVTLANSSDNIIGTMFKISN